MRPLRLALSGSGFKVPAHVGALQAVYDSGFEPVELAGTSGGSIVAAMAACRMKLADMKMLALTFDWSGMLAFSPLAALRLRGFCDGKRLLDWLTEQTSGLTFGQLSMDLTVVASDVASEAPFEFSRATTPGVAVAQAVRASTSIPFAFEPVRLGTSLLADGGMVNNIPVDRLRVDDVPRLGVQLVSQDLPMQPDTSLSPIGFSERLIDLMLSACESTHVSAAQAGGAHMSFVETGYASTLDRTMPLELRQRLFNDGYNATKAALALIAAPVSTLQ